MWHVIFLNLYSLNLKIIYSHNISLNSVYWVSKEEHKIWIPWANQRHYDSKSRLSSSKISSLKCTEVRKDNGVHVLEKVGHRENRENPFGVLLHKTTFFCENTTTRLLCGSDEEHSTACTFQQAARFLCLFAHHQILQHVRVAWSLRPRSFRKNTYFSFFLRQTNKWGNNYRQS